MGKQHSFGIMKAALGHSLKKGFELPGRGQQGHNQWRERLRQLQKWIHVMCVRMSDISFARVTGGQWHRQKGTWNQLLVL